MSGVFVVENISVRANINIRMDQFLKEMDQGSVWKGLFTVEWNGISLADGITGYLQNVPGGEKKGYTVLHIPKEETKEEITMRMNFNLSREDLIWEEAMEDQAEKELIEHPDTKNRIYRFHFQNHLGWTAADLGGRQLLWRNRVQHIHREGEFCGRAISISKRNLCRL